MLSNLDHPGYCYFLDSLHVLLPGITLILHIVNPYSMHFSSFGESLRALLSFDAFKAGLVKSGEGRRSSHLRQIGIALPFPHIRYWTIGFRPRIDSLLHYTDKHVLVSLQK
jgi:hypothetical protein